MKLVTCKDGGLRVMTGLRSEAERFRTGLPAWDALAPGGGWVWGAVHELLYEARASGGLGAAVGGGRSWVPVALLARSAMRAGSAIQTRSKWVVWVDGTGDLFAPALISAGVPADRLVVLRAKSVSDRLWGIAECLRCEAVGVVVGEVGTLSRLWARRLQLAAERGGGVGLLLRDARNASVYAAATRWRVSPEPVTPAEGYGVQRWRIRPVHTVGIDAVEVAKSGGGCVLEVSRELGEDGTSGDVRAFPVVAGGASGAEAAGAEALWAG